MSTSIRLREIEKFAKDSAHWWDESGPFAPLHRMNPARLTYIKDHVCRHFGIDPAARSPYKNLNFLDIGCGGGIACEPLARLGGLVTGIDADEQAIAVAREHAAQSNLSIDYRCGAAEDISRTTFDVVTALEIIEHVEDPAAFIATCAKLVKPGGLVFVSTLNRTALSFVLGIVGAEYVLNWVPQGTHDWRRFLRPSELTRHVRAAGLVPRDVSGIVYRPLRGDFALAGPQTGMNYIMFASKPG